MLDDNSVVAPAGTQWRFTLCPNAQVANCTVVNTTVSGASLNLSALLSAALAVPTVNASPTIARAYKDSEAFGGLGALYVNTTDFTLRQCGALFCNGTGWTIITATIDS